MFNLLETWAIRFLNWKWGREEPRKQKPPVPWTKNTVYVGFTTYECPPDTSDN